MVPEQFKPKRESLVFVLTAFEIARRASASRQKEFHQPLV